MTFRLRFYGNWSRDPDLNYPAVTCGCLNTVLDLKPDAAVGSETLSPVFSLTHRPVGPSFDKPVYLKLDFNLDIKVKVRLTP